MMVAWTGNQLDRIAAADDLHVSPYREDGTTPGTPTWIWSVVVDGSLYVRAYYGLASRWHAAAMRQKAGRISVAGAEHEVTFAPASGAAVDAIDDAYRTKYQGSRYLDDMISPQAKAATVEISPATPDGTSP